MNTQLIKTLAQIIKSLSEEERTLLEAELNPKNDWKMIKQRIIDRNQNINQQTGEKTLEPSIDDIFHQMREERSQELMKACFSLDYLKLKDKLFKEETVDSLYEQIKAMKEEIK